MIAVDTNILARFYVDDPTDAEAARQRPIARRVVEQTEAIHVPVTVVQELVWVLAGHYEFAAEDCARVIEHLVGLPNVHLEDAHQVMEAVRLYREGLDSLMRCTLPCRAIATPCLHSTTGSSQDAPRNLA